MSSVHDVILIFGNFIQFWQCLLFRSGDGYVNFEKFWQLAKQITDFIAWKQVEVSLEDLFDMLPLLSLKLRRLKLSGSLETLFFR